MNNEEKLKILDEKMNKIKMKYASFKKSEAHKLKTSKRNNFLWP